jgi:hypothetical protein
VVHAPIVALPLQLVIDCWDCAVCVMVVSGGMFLCSPWNVADVYTDVACTQRVVSRQCGYCSSFSSPRRRSGVLLACPSVKMAQLSHCWENLACNVLAE